ncbi:hypothetical protein V865_006899 [Kwoniella europaea PYCC6329]|uniref:F-box domain-containing protein n=1 Tax=Kwoniella europaea PYCC6329 TaxID=1423913 RepID=A0AAX4KQK4_9TREE
MSPQHSPRPSALKGTSRGTLPLELIYEILLILEDHGEQQTLANLQTASLQNQCISWSHPFCMGRSLSLGRPSSNYLTPLCTISINLKLDFSSKLWKKAVTLLDLE